MQTQKQVSLSSDRANSENLTLAAHILKILGRRWFASSFEVALDHQMAELLFAVYVFAELKNPLSKKKAWEFVGVSDVKTARKYLGHAIELNLFRAVRSESDKRVSHLYPSARLREMIQKELREIGDGSDIKRRSFGKAASEITITIKPADFSNLIGKKLNLEVFGGAAKDPRKANAKLTEKKKRAAGKADGF
jgi:hypothetical protein